MVALHVKQSERRGSPFYSAVHGGVCKGKDPSVKSQQVLSEDLKAKINSGAVFLCLPCVCLTVEQHEPLCRISGMP